MYYVSNCYILYYSFKRFFETPAYGLEGELVKLSIKKKSNRMMTAHSTVTTIDNTRWIDHTRYQAFPNLLSRSANIYTSHGLLYEFYFSHRQYVDNNY